MSEHTPRPHHVLVVTRGPDFDADDPYYETEIECIDNACANAVIECAGDHDGYHPDDEDSPAFDRYEDVEIHGVLHDWHCWSWTIPFDGCAVKGNEAADECAYDIAGDVGAGRWEVETEWDDESCLLGFIGPAEVSA